MGNTLARQFQDAPLGQGHLTSTQAARQTALVPDAVVLHTYSPRTLWVHKQAKSSSNRHRIRFVHAETSNLLFVNSTTTTSNSMTTTTTKDFKGQLLFVTKAPHKDLRVIYKVLEQPAAPEGTAPSEASSSNMEDEPDHANPNHNNHKKQPDDYQDGWTPVAKIEIDHVAACLTAFLSVKRDTPPKGQTPTPQETNHENHDECVVGFRRFQCILVVQEFSQKGQIILPQITTRPPE